VGSGKEHCSGVGIAVSSLIHHLQSSILSNFYCVLILVSENWSNLPDLSKGEYMPKRQTINNAVVDGKKSQ